MTQLRVDELLSYLSGSQWVCTISGKRKISGDANSTNSANSANSTDTTLRVVLRTVVIDGSSHIHVERFKQRQHEAENIPLDHNILRDLLAALAAQGFSQAHVQTPQKDVYMRCTKKSVLQRTTRPSRSSWENKSEHDEKKRTVLRNDNAFDLLHALGFVTDQGEVIPKMSAKFRQVNHALTLMLASPVFKESALCIVDAGCGKAYLSLALAYILKNTMGCNVRLVGIDSNPHLVSWCTSTAASLNMEYCSFVCSPIAEYKQDDTIDVLLALHACDTATDDALALAVKHNARAIFAAPCCHHFVNARMSLQQVRASLAPLLRDGIGKERLADVITDTMRRDLLRSNGYSAELIEFVAQEHTMKNIMIKAERNGMPEKHQREAYKQYQELRQEWQVWPRLAELLDPVPADAFESQTSIVE